MGQKDYASVLDSMRLTEGTVWPVPICLDVPEKIAGGLQQGSASALRDEEGFLPAILRVTEIWKPDKHAYAQSV